MGDAPREAGVNVGYLGMGSLTATNTMWRTRVNHERTAREAAASRSPTKWPAPVSPDNYNEAVEIQSNLRQELLNMQWKSKPAHDRSPLKDRGATWALR